MTQKSKKEHQNRTKIVKIRLTEAERDLIEKKATEYSDGNLSEYVRILLLNKKVPVEIYDTTVEKFCIAIGEFTQHIKKIGVNYNQITRFIQSKRPPAEANLLLGKGKEMYSEILKYTAEIYKIAKKTQRHYDSQNQQK